MKVITDKEIVVQHEGQHSEYSNAFGDKLKGLVGSGKVKSVADIFLGGDTGNTGSGTYTPPAPPARVRKPKPKMKTGTKVLIGAGSALVLGLVIYLATRKKK